MRYESQPETSLVVEFQFSAIQTDRCTVGAYFLTRLKRLNSSSLALLIFARSNSNFESLLSPKFLKNSWQ